MSLQRIFSFLVVLSGSNPLPLWIGRMQMQGKGLIWESLRGQCVWWLSGTPSPPSVPALALGGVLAQTWLASWWESTQAGRPVGAQRSGQMRHLWAMVLKVALCHSCTDLDCTDLLPSFLVNSCWEHGLNVSSSVENFPSVYRQFPHPWICPVPIYALGFHRHALSRWFCVILYPWCIHILCNQGRNDSVWSWVGSGVCPSEQLNKDREPSMWAPKS